jgi:hypothetical protein
MYLGVGCITKTGTALSSPLNYSAFGCYNGINLIVVLTYFSDS